MNLKEIAIWLVSSEEVKRTTLLAIFCGFIAIASYAFIAKDSVTNMCAVSCTSILHYPGYTTRNLGLECLCVGTNQTTVKGNWWENFNKT